MIRTRVSEIRETGRNAAGVSLIKLDEGDKLVAMAKIDAEEEVKEEGATPETPPAPDATPPAPGTVSPSNDLLHNSVARVFQPVPSRECNRKCTG